LLTSAVGAAPGSITRERAIIGGGLMRQQRERVGQIAPAKRLLMQGEDVGFGSLRYRRYQAVEIGLRCACGEIAVEQRHVEGGMLAAHETGATGAVGVPERERQQQQRTAFRVIGDHDEGGEALRARRPAAARV
jgi:hypothetical protein